MPTLNDCDWKKYRAWLHLLAQEMHRDPRLGQRFDASDLVQQSLLQAQQDLDKGQFRGQSEAELCAWLREILANVLIDGERRHRAGKRDVAREQSLVDVANDSSVRLEGWLQGNLPTPAEQAQRRERMLLLKCILNEVLGPDHRAALENKYIRGLSLAEIAVEMGRTEGQVAGLLRTGLQKLRNLPDKRWEDLR